MSAAPVPRPADPQEHVVRRVRHVARPVAPFLIVLGLLATVGCSTGAEAEADDAVAAAVAPTVAATAPTTAAPALLPTTVPPTTLPPTTLPPTTLPPTTVPPTTLPPTTLPPTTVAPTLPPTTAASPRTTAAPPVTASRPNALPAGTETFRIPMNGRVSVSLAWDCGGCVVELGAKHHPAIDYVSRDDKTIVASGSGIVIVVNDGCASPSQGCGQSMGNSIFLRHVLADGSAIHTFYAHLSEIDPEVVVGACVQAGQRLGTMGNSGIGSAAHLHFAFQTTPEILQYTVESSYEYGSRDPEDFYGIVEVRRCG